MKKIIFMVVSIFILSSILLQAQVRQDVIYLKNGDILKGEIIENVPNDYVRIELKGGSVFTVKHSDIKKFTREKIYQQEKAKKETPAQTNIIMQQQQQQQQQVVSPPKKPKDTGLTDAQKMALYESQKLSPATARLLSFFISSAGHWYSGNGGTGLLFLGARVFSFTMAANATTKSNQAIWLINFGLFSIWEIIDAGKKAEQYNARLYNSIMNGIPNFSMNFEPLRKICGVPVQDGIKLNFKYNF